MIGLPSLAQFDRTTSTRIWLCLAPTDMRRGFDGLAEQVRSVTRQDPQSGHLFLFRSRGGDRLKALWWDKDGYALWHKRLEEGTFKLPKAAAESCSVELRASKLTMILDGVKRVKRYRRETSV